MWYSSRGETYGHRVRPLTDTSTYLHWDVGYGIPSQTNSAQRRGLSSPLGTIGARKSSSQKLPNEHIHDLIAGLAQYSNGP